MSRHSIAGSISMQPVFSFGFGVLATNRSPGETATTGQEA